jgi:hypothetical protein
VPLARSTTAIRKCEEHAVKTLQSATPPLSLTEGLISLRRLGLFRKQVECVRLHSQAGEFDCLLAAQLRNVRGFANLKETDKLRPICRKTNFHIRSAAPSDNQRASCLFEPANIVESSEKITRKTRKSQQWAVQARNWCQNSRVFRDAVTISCRTGDRNLAPAHMQKCGVH